MAETENIARMAELLSQELFGEFLWSRSGPMNQNWACERAETHKVDTHPTDLVFYYDEPYSTKRTYIQTDLKSYARGSITSGSIRSAIKSLAKQVSCAEISENWRNLYAHTGVTYDICGMLFVYNHDGEYDREFETTFREIKNIDLDLPLRSRLYIVGPDDIFWLDNVRLELQRLRGASSSRKIPERQYCSFVFPQLVRKANLRAQAARAATMEMLSSSWILMKYLDPSRHRADNYIMFYRRAFDNVDECMYIIDYLRHHELLRNCESVTIRVRGDGADKSVLLFDKAKAQYIDEVLGQSREMPMAQVVDGIRCEPLQQVQTSFSAVVLGMS